MGNLKPNGQRAKNAITLIWIVLALEVVSLASAYYKYNLLKSYLNGSEISDSAAGFSDLFEQITGLAYLVAFIISAVFFIQWFRRAYYNLHQKLEPLSYSEGWAAGSWFVPILNLFRPYRIMKEMYTETQHFLLRRGIDFKESLSARTVGIWWTLWIISSILGQVVFRLSLKEVYIEDIITSTFLAMISNIVNIPLAFAAVKVIKDYARVEPLLYEFNFEEESQIFNSSDLVTGNTEQVS